MNYQLQNNTYFATANEDRRNRLDVEVGDAKQTEFHPQIKLKRWHNEINFSARLVHRENISNIKPFCEYGKIKWRAKKFEVHFYDVPQKDEDEGGYEFEIILLEKPDTNKFEFTIQHKGLEFCYQPELTKKEKKQGHERSENIVGSYAVYYKEPPKNFAGSNVYKSGKAFHIFRPEVKDSGGNKIWADLHIDSEKGILSITVNKAFLKHAVYPIHIDPTFGYATIGASSTYIAANALLGTLGTAQSGTANSISFYGRYYSAPIYIKGILVTASNLYILSGGITPPRYVNSTVWQWWTASFSSPPAIAGVQYYASIIANGYVYVRYDSGPANSYLYHTGNFYTSPINPTAGYKGPYMFSIYCTYTVASTSWKIKFNDSVVGSDVPKKSPRKVFAELANYADSIKAGNNYQVRDVVVLSDAKSFSPFGKFLSESLALNESSIKEYGNNQTDAISSSDSSKRAIKKAIAELMLLEDQALIPIGMILSDSPTLFDEFETVANYHLRVDDLLEIDDWHDLLRNMTTSNYMVLIDGTLFVVVNGRIIEAFK